MLLALVCLVSGFCSVPVRAQSVLRFSGTTAVGATAPAQPVTVTLTRAGRLDAIKVRTLGNDGFDFANASGGSCSTSTSYSAGQQCTVQVAFGPTAPGWRQGAVVLLSSSNVVLGTQLLLAQATGPIGTFIPGMINTVAGEPTWIYSGDNGPATENAIFLPFGVAVDAAGDMFIADSSNQRIRKVDGPTQIITTIAGNGSVGVTGDGGPATEATMNNPTSVVVDALGNVFFSDNGNNIIRRINAFDGTISTIAGTAGRHGYSGDGGPATAAMLNSPNGLALDVTGNLFIADTTNNVVRMVNAATGIISTVAGTGTAGFTGDGGPANVARLNGPWGVTMSPVGALYIADQNNARIRMVDASGNISTVAGSGAVGYSGDSGPATAAQLNVPAGTAIDVAGNLFVADSGNNVVRKIYADTGAIWTVAGGNGESISGDGGPANTAGLYGPYTLAIDSQGSLYIADVFHNRIRKVSSNAATLRYPPIREGRVSEPLTQILENDGNAPLTVGTISAVTNAQVDLPTTVCSSSAPLAPLAQCIIGADFAPTMVGNPVLGTINVDADSSNFPGTISLLGQVLNVDPAGVTLTSSANPSVTGSSVVFRALVTSVGTTPTGTVSLLDGTSILASGQLGPGGNVSFTLSTLTAGQHNMTASYAGDTNNAAGTSAVLVQVVRDPVAPTTTNISSSSNPVFAGASLTLTAQVQAAVAGSGNGAITGSVSFMNGSVLLATATVVNGTATAHVSTLTVGSDGIVANYAGNTSYGASASPSLLQQVQIASTHTVLSSNANPSSAGGSLTLTATVVSNGGIPTGPVAFLDGSVSLGTASLNATGVATLAVSGSAWTVGTHPLSASYAGDQNDSASVSSAFPQVVNLATTSVHLTSSLNPAALGAAVTFSAAVSGTGGTPTGTVQFFDGATALGTGTLNGTGVATVSNAALALGSHNITAVYSGDGFDATSTSPALTEVIQPANIGVALTTSQNPSLFGSAVDLIATVTGNGSTPTGSVSFADGTTALGVITLGANGTATLSPANLSIGTHSIVAAYSGDANHNGATSPALSQVVIQGTTTTLAVSTPNSIAGTSLTFTAAVTGAAGRPAPGTITILDGQTTLATLAPTAAGTVSFTTSALAPGQHSLTASYSGDPLDQASTSAAVGENVTIAATAATLASSANPSFSGTPLTLTASVTGNGGLPTGKVTFLDGTSVIGSQSLSAGGIATFTTSNLAPGIHRLSASYGGDTDDQPAVSATLSEQIAEHTTVDLASSANPSLLSDTVTYTVTVSNGVPAAAPTGQVTLSDGGVTVGTVSLNPSGLAIFIIPAPQLGQHTMVAAYAGDMDNVPATSQPLIQTVTLRPTTASLSSSATSLSLGQQLVLISVVQGAGPRPPTGTVTFASGSTVLGTVPVAPTGLATLLVSPPQGVYGVVASFSGDALFAASNSPSLAITVGPPVEFNIALQPPTISMQSGAHGSMQIAVVTAPTFSDTIAFGCAGLPASATCTFSGDKMAVGGGVTKTLTVIVDTGDPLGGGPSAKLALPASRAAGGGGVLACMLPAGGLLALLLGRRKLRRPLSLLAMALMLAGVATLSGCGSTFNTQNTPAGGYTFQIVGTGQTTGATQTATVQLTVTK